MGQNTVNKYLSLVKFSHTLFAMPFAITGYFLAISSISGAFSWKLLGLVVLCMVFARNAAMAFNRYADRHFDKLNPRTALREIPAGIIKAESAIIFVIVNSICFWAVTWFINPLVFLLAPIALLVILGYSFTKRFTALCHFVLGIGLALAPIGAWLAVTGSFSYLPLLLSFAVLFWVSGFDIIYALQDESFDKSISLKSVPALLGVKKALLLSTLLHIACGILIIIFGIYGLFGLWYWLGAVIFLLLLGYQHLIVKPHNLSRINIAFGTTNGIASVLFATFSIVDMLA
jgi:4-hydroxybenzoate polyprenyltransferase